ncbi:uncharacterized protein [Rutidosis leptorrhynchoides]|uniref:uncharacterized protein n=1 Tax=Rutidosis leptorrhynchoides TaxID=125765 RepID=UPI003A99EB1D
MTSDSTTHLAHSGFANCSLSIYSSKTKTEFGKTIPFCVLKICEPRPLQSGNPTATKDLISFSTILHHSLSIESTTTLMNGHVQSFIGLRYNYPAGPTHSGQPKAENRHLSFSNILDHTLIIKSMKTKMHGQLRSVVGLKIIEPRAPTPPGTQVSYHNQGPPSFKCMYCNATMWYEERSNKPKKTTSLTFSLCCQNGKLLLPKLQDPPMLLKTLLDYTTSSTAKFREQIRIYNSIFSFTSFGAKIDHSVNHGRGPYTFRISGQAYHKIGSLLPEDGGHPRYAQLYFFDTENETRNRMSAFIGSETRKPLDEEITNDLITMLNEYSAVAKAFRIARDWSTNNTSSEFQLRLLAKVTNSRQYNTPTVAEVAALITSDFGQCTTTRDIIVQKKNCPPKRISELHQLYMALQYPLLFPYGETGYHEEIPYHNNNGRRKTNRGFVTMREYYCYMIQQRENEGTTLLRGGRLFQQYLVDAYTAVEEQRLKWLRNHQNELRLDLYNNNYQDAIALYREFDNPDLFITFTSNPKWPEIEGMLSYIEGQRAPDRPDIVARLFKLKLDSLMTDIMKTHIFGTTKAGIHIIEFQKRGLPHVHMLIWLTRDCKCKSPSDIDDIISAKIPSQINDPEGYKCVTEYMLHGPCGPQNMDAPCMIDRKCSKHFPKPYYAETTIDEDGYANYRRRNNGEKVRTGKGTLDNSFVVPYNRFLLLKYNAHINVEWCNRSRAIKYLFKYLNKGPDRATIVIQENLTPIDNSSLEKVTEVDEIKNYLDCRYLSPCEAVWRMFSFDIHFSQPSVIKLSYHLPNQQAITVHDSQNLPALLHRESIKETMFTEWFELNKRDQHARNLTYAKIPIHYVWNQDTKEWTPRKQRRCIGCIVYSNPASGERYYLRMLLNIVKGPLSFEDIRRVDGTLHPTFKDACFARGLINDDKEWTEAISEATLWASGSQLRDLFVTILLFYNVSKPLKLWETHWEALADDILRKKRKLYNYPDLILNEAQLQNYCLVEIQAILNKNGKSLADYPDLPQPDQSFLTQMDNRLIREELNYNIKEMQALHNSFYNSLNPEQLSIYQQVIMVVTKKTGGLFFLYGPGSTGKTFVYNTILTKLRSEKMIVLAVASSGIASLLLPRGRTAHSRFVIPLELMENSTCGIKQNTHLAALMQEARLIIWDEAPMTKQFAFEALDKTLRDILGTKDNRNRGKLFGGMPILLGGDFRQILPVIPKGKRQEVVQACINSSDLWNHCQLHTLTRIIRVNEYTVDGHVDTRNKLFNKWVLDIGDGHVPVVCRDGEDEPSWIKIPA